MIVKDIIYEDFINYKEPSMFVIFPRCSFKCDIENGCKLCQNSDVALQPDIHIDANVIVKHYINNPITKAVVCGGLEPFDTEDDLYDLITKLRRETTDTVVIYTGYTEEEISKYHNKIYEFENIIIKFGRFRPNQEPHFDELLGINLMNCEQYARKIG